MSTAGTGPRHRAGAARRGGLAALAALVVLGGLAWGGYWYAYLRHYQSTDDAYVAGDVVQITSEVPGTVMALHVDDTQVVHRGDALLELDPADAEVAMAAAQAGLAEAVRQLRALFAQAQQGRAQIAEREIALQRAQEDFKRRASLAGLGGVSAEELAHARDAITEMTAALDTARRQLDVTVAQIAGTTPATNPLVLAAAARVREAALALRRTRVLAPVDGVVAKRAVQVGQRVAPGTPLLAVVPLENVWVDANFKEVQLERMRVGQPVTVHADLYGDVVFHGRVAGLAAGTGGAFALLPSQNASGNWIKIVQRVPVRILLDQAELEAHPLRLGLSVVADVDVRDASGARPAAPLRNRPLPANPSGGSDPAIEAAIARIIADNAGGEATAKKDGW